jgi:hypothetical protein
MKIKHLTFLAVAAGALIMGGTTPVIAAPVVLNNSFEATTGPATLNPQNNYTVGFDLTSVVNWTFADYPTQIAGVVTAYGVSPTDRGGLQAWSPFPDGTNAAFVYGQSTFSQDVTGFDAASYTVSFYGSARPSYQNGLVVKLDGTTLTFNTPEVTWVLPTTDAWTLFTSDAFVTTAGTHTLSFTGSTGTDLSAFVDVVNVNAVPEPATMGLFGLGGLLLVLRRRKSL